ncbi:MAG TPA: L-fuculokinase [bacterium]|nr:L-fuculokinase [bacterium]
MSSRKPAALVLDCGATNVRAILVDAGGRLLASASRANAVHPDPGWPGGLIWDQEEIWAGFCACTRELLSRAPEARIAAITVTTFGVDGAPVHKDGTLLHPVISWQCGRTRSIQEKIASSIDPLRLFRITGLQSYPFNTLFRLLWFRENRPGVLEGMDYYAMMPSLFIHRLTGEWLTDVTMAGTSMLTDQSRRTFSEELLALAGLDATRFPALAEPGTIAGPLLPAAAAEFGLAARIPVVIAGHDTQFALFGAGGGPTLPVLSSGTWEILMARSTPIHLEGLDPAAGITIEFDARPGLCNPGMMWIASGILEWLGGLLYSDCRGAERYEKMTGEASLLPPGSEGVGMLPGLFDSSGLRGVYSGLFPGSTRAHLYRAALEALAFRARESLIRLEEWGGFRAGAVICAGGGSKNHLWNRIRADILGIPVLVSPVSETTVLGAAMFALAGAGFFSTPEEAARAMQPEMTTIEPGENLSAYVEFLKTYRGLLHHLDKNPAARQESVS